MVTVTGILFKLDKLSIDRLFAWFPFSTVKVDLSFVLMERGLLPIWCSMHFYSNHGEIFLFWPGKLQSKWVGYFGIGIIFSLESFSRFCHAHCRVTLSLSAMSNRLCSYLYQLHSALPTGCFFLSSDDNEAILQHSPYHHDLVWSPQGRIQGGGAAGVIAPPSFSDFFQLIW